MPKQTNKYPGIKKIGKDHYEITVEAGKKPDGSRDRVKRRFHGTITEAKAFKLQLESEIAQGSFLRPTKMTVSEYLYFWLDHLNDSRAKPLRPKTIQGYRSRIESHLVPALGGIPLDKLNVMHIQQYIRDAREKGQKPRRKKTEYKGTVNVSDKEVKWASGDRFAKCLTGRAIEINGKTCIIVSYDSSTRLTLDSSAGTQTKVSYKVDLAEFKPFSERTINYSLIVLRMALKAAVKPYKLIKENPAEDIEISAQTKRKKCVITPDQMKKIFKYLTPTDRRIAIYALFTGVRRGEALGLLWSRVDFNVSAAKIDRSLQRITGKGLKMDDPKSDASNRPLDLPRPIIAMLKQIKVEQAKNKLALGPDYQDNCQGVIDVSGPLVTWKKGDKFAPYLANKRIKINGQAYNIVSVESKMALTLDRTAGVQRGVPYLVDNLDLVFCQYNGKPLDPDGVSKKFKKACRAAGFPDMRFHDLRHNFASWMLADSEQLHVVQELLGHEKASTTEDIYAEAIPGSHKAAMDKFAQKYSDLICDEPEESKQK
jgi:integrase